MNVNNICPFSDLGLKPKKVMYIPLRSENGLPLDKFLRVTVGSKLHDMINRLVEKDGKENVL